MKDSSPWLLVLALILPDLARGAAPAGLPELARDAGRELRENILPFWLQYAPAAKRDGFNGLVDDHRRIVPDAPRGALLTSRILWTFSAAYRTYHDPAHLEMARRAYRDLTDNFTDREAGGLYWSITADGRPADTRKQVYGQVFGIYALAEYYRATGEQPALDQAIAIYRLLETHARDPEHGGYFDVFDRNWRRTADATNLLGNAPKSQNSHIHILEAFTNLLRVWPDAGLRERQRALIELMLDRIIDARTRHLVLFFKADWTPLGDEVSYGHDIELSWLLVEAADVLGDPALGARVRPVALAMADAVLQEGVAADGGMFDEGGPRGITRDSKGWWSQAEAAVGFLNAYELSRDPRYLAAARHSWDFIQAKVVDRTYGDWVISVSRDGRPTTGPKIETWKCPYHNSRACLELIARVHELTGGAKP